MSEKCTISCYNHKKALVLNVMYHDDDDNIVNFMMMNNISLKILCREEVWIKVLGKKHQDV